MTDLNWREGAVERLRAKDKTIERLGKRIAELESALREIRDITPPYQHKDWPHHHRYYYLAKQALGERDGN